MKKLIVLILFVFFAIGNAAARDYYHDGDSDMLGGRKMENYHNRQYPRESQIMEPYRENGYGLGVHQDRSGEAFQFRDDRGRVNDLGDVRQDSVGDYRNQFGERVKPYRYGD